MNDENGIPWLASSPDGLVQIDTITDSLGVLEIKCPFMGGKPVPYRNVCANHIPQVMLEMYCTNTKWCHYVVWTRVGNRPCFVLKTLQPNLKIMVLSVTRL